MTFRRLMIALAAAITLGSALIQGQVPGRNVNMVSGRTLPDGDPFLQRQNEPSIAASTRNPLHLLAGANDYRTVDLPGLPADNETGDAWMGVFKSYDGGNTWRTTLIPGYPQDTSDAGKASPLWRNPAVPGSGYAAAADPVVRKTGDDHSGNCSQSDCTSRFAASTTFAMTSVSFKNRASSKRSKRGWA